MTTFLRLLEVNDKSMELRALSSKWRRGQEDSSIFVCSPKMFERLPGASFAYWASEEVQEAFERSPSFDSMGRRACIGLSTKDDARFLRLRWEVSESIGAWTPFVKGGAFSKFYADPYLLVDWRDDGKCLKAFAELRTAQIFGVGGWSRWINSWSEYFRPGLTWSIRTKSRLSMRVMPRGCIFSHKGPGAFVSGDKERDLLCLLAICASDAFHELLEVQLAAADARPGGAAHSFEVGVIQKTPVVEVDLETQDKLAALARAAWSHKRTADTIDETSHAFSLPAALRGRIGAYDPPAIEAELARIQEQVDSTVGRIYGFSGSGRGSVKIGKGLDSARTQGDDDSLADDADDDERIEPLTYAAGLFSWAVGVAFGRFDWRLATGERMAPPEPEPFDPLPAKSPGMLPDDSAPFHAHDGILVDDVGHPHDLARVIEEILARVDAPVPSDLRRWLQRDFFPTHLQRYSRSRRKAPVYWPLSTISGSYTLWVYYPNLTSQTAYTAVNDFVEPKLKQLSSDLGALRNKGAARNRDDEKRLEAFQAFELELIELRDNLLKLAPTYKPKLDDGVQISAAPLWPLFRHKPWQKLLKDTWTKLEKGEYDWAHMAMNYWPDRVCEKCKTDKSLAIAHGLESLYVAPEVAPKKTRGKMKGAEA